MCRIFLWIREFLFIDRVMNADNYKQGKNILYHCLVYFVWVSSIMIPLFILYFVLLIEFLELNCLWIIPITTLIIIIHKVVYIIQFRIWGIGDIKKE